jgi:hypothetical protein
MEKTPEPPAASSDELKLLYQVTVADLAYFKQQQWSIANYGLLLFAGLCASAKLFSPPASRIELVALAVLVFITATATSIVLWKHQASITIRRSRLKATRERFSKPFHDAWGTEGKLDERFEVCWLLQGALVLGAVVSLWVLARQ